jgi:hypothetical protein
VRVYYFEKDEESQKIKVSKVELDEKGEIEGGLRGFFEADMQHIDKFFENIVRKADSE